MEEKIPELKKTLQAVDFLMKPRQEDTRMQFELTETVWAKVSVPPTDSVYLWLGVCLCNEGQS